MDSLTGGAGGDRFYIAVTNEIENDLNVSDTWYAEEGGQAHITDFSWGVDDLYLPIYLDGNRNYYSFGLIHEGGNPHIIDTVIRATLSGNTTDIIFLYDTIIDEGDVFDSRDSSIHFI